MLIASREKIATELRRYDEDTTADWLLGCSADEELRVASVSSWLVYHGPRTSAGSMLFAKACALAAVYVHEGAPRELARKARKPVAAVRAITPVSPGPRLLERVEAGTAVPNEYGVGDDARRYWGRTADAEDASPRSRRRPAASTQQIRPDDPTSPKAVIDQAGRHLAEVLDGLSWTTSTRRLKGPTVDGQHLELRLQSSSWSRAGAGTWLNDVYVKVHDSALRRWRREHPDAALRQDDWLFLGSVGNLATRRVTFELFGPLRDENPERYGTLEDLVEVLSGEVLPGLACLRDPTSAADGLPERWLNRPSYVVEWAVSRGEPDAARRLIRRCLEPHPAWVPPFERGWAAASRGEPADHNNLAAQFGAAVHRVSSAVDKPLWP